MEQKKYQKAIQAYEILILKYPEKSSFFADRINDIKILQQRSKEDEGKQNYCLPKLYREPLQAIPLPAKAGQVSWTRLI